MAATPKRYTMAVEPVVKARKRLRPFRATRPNSTLVRRRRTISRGLMNICSAAKWRRDSSAVWWLRLWRGAAVMVSSTGTRCGRPYAGA